MLRILALAAAFASAASPAAAEMHKLGDTVAGHPGVTYGALLRQAVPDLKQDGDSWKGSTVAHYRHLLGKESDNGAPDEIAITDVDVQHVHEAGQDRLVLLSFNADAPNDWFALLAAFDTGKKPRLLDAANIAGDQYNGYFEPALLKLAGGNDAILVSSTHSNSNQAYAIVSAVVLRGGKLLPALTVMTLQDHACTYNRTQELSFAAHGMDISAKVEESTAVADEDCGEKPTLKNGRRTIRDTWTWDAKKGRYIAKTGAFDRLFKENVGRD